MAELLSRLALDEKAEAVLVDDGESDDDEEEAAAAVQLGFVRAPKKPWKLRRQHFPCKAGGAAAWLDPDSFPRMPEGCCDFCEEPLQFLLQIYAPLAEDRADTFHRMLFVFMCPKMACLQRDRAEQKKRSHIASRSVKVFRCQLPLKNSFYAHIPSKKEKDLPLTNGADLCQWCGTWRGEKRCGGCRKFKYCSRQHQVEHWRSGHSTSCKGDTVPSTNESIRWLSNWLWPELELYIEDEIDEDENALQIIPGVSQPVAVDPELQNCGEATAEQKYLARFQACMAKAPTQVLRYCRERGAKVLWMKPDERPTPADILPCQICGGPRMFEFQVLPQLLYFFKVENEPDSLDWSTVAIYSCSDSCAVEGYCSEFVWVQ